MGCFYNDYRVKVIKEIKFWNWFIILFFDLISFFYSFCNGIDVFKKVVFGYGWKEWILNGLKR